MKRVQKYIQIIGLAIIALLAIIGITLIGVGFKYKKSLYPNITVAGQELGEKTLKEAYPILEQEAEIAEKSLVTLTLDDKSKTSTISELGIDIDPEKTLVTAFRSKRGEILRGIPAMATTYTIDWEYTVNHDTLNSRLEETFGTTLTDTENARITITDGALTILPAKPGETIDTETLSQNILTSYSATETSIIEIPIITQQPEITEDIITQALPQIESITKIHTLSDNDGQTWQIQPEEIIRWIRIANDSTISLDENLIKEFLNTLSGDIAREPRNARIRFNTETKSLEELSPSIEGRTLLIEESTRRIRDNLLDSRRETTLFVSVQPAQISSENLKGLGITTLIGQGESNFVGSSSSRIANIKVAADKISGSLIAPGEEFSFVGTLGAVNASTGYYPELVIKGSKTIPEYGGGVCQVSTTLFRAALNTGLEITERHPHSYVVSYYGTPGLDATIYVPSPDFKFRNTTDHSILIQHTIDGTKLTYEIYGTDPGLDVTIIGPTILESNWDGSKKTVAYREISKNGQLISKDSFYSSYRPPNKVNTNPLE